MSMSRKDFDELSMAFGLALADNANDENRRNAVLSTLSHVMVALQATNPRFSTDQFHTAALR
jgi:hypothetical protein